MVESKTKPGRDELENWQTQMASLAELAPEHARLRDLVGTWDAHVKFWMTPGAGPIESAGTSVNTLIMGGRYLQSEFSMPDFEGRGFVGFDRVRNEHVSAWLDSMGTGISLARGKADEGGRRLEVFADDIDCATRQPVSHRMVTRYLSSDEHVWEMFATLTGGVEHQVMEITYRRRR